MKNVLYVICAALFLVACQEEELVNLSQNNDTNGSKIQLVQVVDGTQIIPINATSRNVDVNAEYALQFDSEVAYEETLEKLDKMSNIDKLSFVKQYGLLSIQELLNVADKELEEIEVSAKNEADFRTKYEEYKKKYEGILISNEYDSEDFSLYVPDGDNVSTYLVEKSKLLIIGNKIKKISLSQEMSETDKVLFTPRNIYYADARAASNLDCGFQEFLGAKKTTCNVHLEPANLFVSVSIGIQKKKWYGWRRDNHRDIYYHIGLTNFTYNFWGPYGQQVNVSCPSLYAFKGTGKIDYKTGYLTGARNSSGKIYVWHDIIAGSEMVTHNGVVIDNKYERSIVLPKCDKASAYSTEINLYF